MDVMQAAYRVAHDFLPDGATGLARKMGQPVGTFLNRVNPEQETHLLSLLLAVAMTTSTKDYRILHAFADTCDHLAIPKPDFSRVSDASLLEMLLKRDQADGEFAQALSEALENGDISAAEFERIEKEGYEAAAALLELIERVRGLVRVRR